MCHFVTSSGIFWHTRSVLKATSSQIWCHNFGLTGIMSWVLRDWKSIKNDNFTFLSIDVWYISYLYIFIGPESKKLIFCSDFEHFGQDFEVQVQARFWSWKLVSISLWCLVEVMMLNLGQYSKNWVWSRFQLYISMLMFAWDFEVNA